MAGINKVLIIGRLGNNPEIRTMPNGDTVAKISIATSESWTDKQSGEKKELTEWHTVIAFRKLAEIMEKYLKKGSQVYIEGKLRTRKWQDQHGQDRWTTEIIADTLQMLDSKPQGETNSQQPQSSNPNAYAQAKEGRYNPPPQATDSFDDGIPF